MYKLFHNCIVCNTQNILGILIAIKKYELIFKYYHYFIVNTKNYYSNFYYKEWKINVKNKYIIF